ncbi:MAG: hypothetical protein DMG39_05820 [Acidobacteria bacterium]|nr:MAG: hypothetical protein DMG39_05820 [Acidobacteriota bacterium]
MTTSKKDARYASQLLRNKRTGKKTKSVAGSDLSQGKGSRGKNRWEKDTSVRRRLICEYPLVVSSYRGKRSPIRRFQLCGHEGAFAVFKQHARNQFHLERG